MNVDTNQTICFEIAHQEGFDPFKCDIRVTNRDKDGTPKKLIFYAPKKEMIFFAFPTIMFDQTEGCIWKHQ